MSEEVVLKFAQKLASNELKIRKRTLKKLVDWLGLKSQSKNGINEEELLKIWKGLHYCMWMCDKPLVQEELADSLCQLLHIFSSFDHVMLFVSTFFQTEAREWVGIDRLRLNKFMMLIRRFLHQVFVVLQKQKWQNEHIEALVRTLTDVGVIGSDSEKVTDGLKWHIIDVYLVELAKVGAKELTGDQTLMFLDSYCSLLASTKKRTLHDYINENIVGEIINQAKESHREKVKGNNSEDGGDMDGENEEDSDEENDIEMDDESQVQPRLQFDYSALADRLFNLAKQKSTPAKNRNIIYAKVTQLRKIASGVFPEEAGEEEVDSDSSISDDEMSGAFDRLVEMEDGIMRSAQERREAKKRKKKHAKGEQLEDGDDDFEMMDDEAQSPEDTAQSESTAANKKTRNKFKEGEEKLKAKEKKKAREALNAERKAEKKKLRKKQREVTAGGIAEEVHLGDSGSDISDGDDDDDEINLATIEQLLKKSGKNGTSSALFEGGFMDSDEEIESETSGKSKVKNKTSGKVKNGGKKAKPMKQDSLMFEGGFVDSDDDEIESETTGKSKGKSGKKKGKRTNSESEGVVVSDLVIDTGNSNSSKKKKNKSKKLSIESDSVNATNSPILINDSQGENNDINLENETISDKSSSKKNKKKRKNSLIVADESDDVLVVSDIVSDKKVKTTPNESKSVEIVGVVSKKSPKNTPKKDQMLKNSADESKSVEIVGVVAKKSPKNTPKKDQMVKNSADESKSVEIVGMVTKKSPKNTPKKEQSVTLLSDEDSSSTPNNDGSKKTPKSSAKKSKKNSGVDNAVIVSDETPVTGSRKKKRKKTESESSDPAQAGDDEVEIFIPNKKYKGQYAEWAHDQASLTMNKENDTSSSGKKKKKQKSGTSPEPFMKFEKNAPTPPAFIRKSVLKTTPKTEPKKGSKKVVSPEAPMSAGKRRVSFGLHKNMAQTTKEYQSSLKKTPDVPFDPNHRPDTGILKQADSPVATPKAKLKFAKTGKLNFGKTGKKGGRRSSAENFF